MKVLRGSVAIPPLEMWQQRSRGDGAGQFGSRWRIYTVNIDRWFVAIISILCIVCFHITSVESNTQRGWRGEASFATLLWKNWVDSQSGQAGAGATAALPHSPSQDSKGNIWEEKDNLVSTLVSSCATSPPWFTLSCSTFIPAEFCEKTVVSRIVIMDIPEYYTGRSRESAHITWTPVIIFITFLPAHTFCADGPPFVSHYSYNFLPMSRLL